MFDLGRGAIEQWERGEKLLGKIIHTRERERERKHLFLIVCKKGFGL